MLVVGYPKFGDENMAGLLSNEGEGDVAKNEGEGDSPFSFRFFCFPKLFLSQLVALPIRLALASSTSPPFSTLPKPNPSNRSALLKDPVRGESATIVMVDRDLGIPPSIGVRKVGSSDSKPSVSDGARGSSSSCRFLIRSRRVWSNCTLSISTSCATPSSLDVCR